MAPIGLKAVVGESKNPFLSFCGNPEGMKRARNSGFFGGGVLRAVYVCVWAGCGCQPVQPVRRMMMMMKVVLLVLHCILLQTTAAQRGGRREPAGALALRGSWAADAHS